MGAATRRKRSGRAAALALVCLLGSAAAACRGPRSSPAPGGPRLPEHERVPGQVLLRMESGTDRQNLDRVLERIDGRILRSWQLVPRMHQVLTPLTPEEAIERLEDEEGVEWVTPNRIVRPAGGGGARGRSAGGPHPTPPSWGDDHLPLQVGALEHGTDAGEVQPERNPGGGRERPAGLEDGGGLGRDRRRDRRGRAVRATTTTPGLVPPAAAVPRGIVPYGIAPPASPPPDNVISVTGVDLHDVFPGDEADNLDFNHGASSVDIAAPAVCILSAGQPGGKSEIVLRKKLPLALLGPVEHGITDWRQAGDAAASRSPSPPRRSSVSSSSAHRFWDRNGKKKDHYVLAEDGTSFAAPFVAGAAALAWSWYGPAAPYTRIRDRILEGVRKVPALAAQGSDPTDPAYVPPRVETEGVLDVRATLPDLSGVLPRCAWWWPWPHAKCLRRWLLSLLWIRYGSW